MNGRFRVFKTQKVFIRLTLFVILGLVLVYRLNSTDFDKLVYEFDLSFILAFLLMPLNWILEYRKWIEILNLKSLSKLRAKEAFASGMLSEFIIPGIPSNFLGRIFYFEPKDRIKLTLWIQIANGIQFLITVSFGLFALIILNLHETSFDDWVAIGSVLIFLLAISKPSRNFLRKYFSLELIQELKNASQHSKLISLTGYSLFRFIVFSIQFALILNSFGIFENISIFLWIWVSYLFVTLTPSLFMGNLVVRESITASVFSFGGFAFLPIVSATFLIWLINNFIPTVMAWFFISFGKKA